MNNDYRRIRQAFIVVCFICLGVGWGQAQKPVLTIGIALDGPWERNQEIRETFEREITQLLEGEYEVRFPVEKQLRGDWTAERAAANLDRLLDDPEVDLVIPMGVLGSIIAGRRDTLPKPVFAPFVIDPELEAIPFEVRERRAPGREFAERFRVSGVPNLSYVVLGHRLPREVEAFREIVPFTRLTILTMRALGETVPELRQNFLDQVAELGIETHSVPVGDSLDEALAQIQPDTEAVYVAPLPQLPPGEFDRLAQALIERRLPSFSLWGKSEVEKGLMASLALDLDINRLARRMALNIHRVVLGERAQDLPIDIQHDEQLTINMTTARAVGVYPSFVLLTKADLVNDQPGARAVRQLSLSDVVREAGRVNLDLAAADRTVAAGLQLIREARSGFLPQFNLSGTGLLIDKDRAEASFGSQGQRQVAGSTGFSQLIYSDQVRAGYDIERDLQTRREEERGQLRLDVILEAAESYLNVLRSKTVESIQRDNLKLTRSNLELAQARVDLGAAGREELFRWESQIATNRAEVIAASAVRNQAEIAVNRVLNRPIEESFLPIETGLDDPDLITSFEQLRPYIENRQSFRIFRRFMVGEAFAGSPELRQFDAAILAQERALLATRRAFYLPTVGLQADVTGFRNGGAGSSGPDLPPDFPFSFAQPNNLNWNVAVNATLPVFQGGALRARRERAQIELDELTVQREATRQRIEQRIRSILHQAGASFAGIELSRAAADAAGRNLELVTDSYREGVVDILRLLDAQNQALVADLVAANAVFDYLVDLMGIQRSLGRFDYFRSPEDRQRFLDQLDEAFRKDGFEIRKR